MSPECVQGLDACLLVLGTKDEESGEWTSTVLSSVHNGENPFEAEKIKKAHPGEYDCFFDERVLGAIAVTRGTS